MGHTRDHEFVLANYLVKRILDRASGKAEEYCYFDKPRNRYFLGSLSTVRVDDQGNITEDHYSMRIAPSAVGMEIRVRPNSSNSKIIFTPNFAIYYRVFPFFNEQTEMLRVQDEVRQQEEDQAEPEEYLIKFKKIVPEITPLEIDLEEGAHSKILDLSNTLDLINNDPRIFRMKSKRKKLPTFEDETDYEKYITETVGEIQLPKWQLSIKIEIRKEEDCYRVKATLQNETVETQDTLRNGNIDGYIFDAVIECKLQNIKPEMFRFDAIPEDYRYDKTLTGYGHNCMVEYNDETNCFVTDYSPIYFQKKYVTRNRVQANFSELATDPVPVLENIYHEMINYYNSWEEEVKRLLNDWEYSTAQGEILKGKQLFYEEIQRFRRGIDVLKDPQKPIVLQSFKLMNEVFVQQDLQRRDPYKSWRLFQIVYIVSIIPDIVSREYSDVSNDIEIVDVLWFPTGGGKTETYLGLVLFNAFFDRLRGKKAGVTAWTRFPLRLLSLQQIQRIADAMGQAEKLRRQTPGINTPEDEPFSVGYLVGEGNTPNALTSATGDKRAIYKTNPKELLKCKIITKCPFCKITSIKMDLLDEEVRIVHRCINENCEEDILPIYVVDNEVYRYLPTMIIGTVDKLSAVGNQRKFAHLFGQVTHKCPKHGYMSAGECTEKYGCEFHKLKSHRPFIPVTLKDPSPSLQIQDELHLLREGLGTFNSHYETFVDYLQQRLQNGVRQKIIAATATIENYQNQIQHMYRRASRRFPESGPTLGESFYATTLPEVHRIFVGVMAHNKTHINTIIELLQMYHEEIQTLKQDALSGKQKVGLDELTDNDFKHLLSLYEVSLTYLLTKREGDRLDQSIEGQITSYLSRHGLRPLKNETLTGSTLFDDVGRILETLENPPEDEIERITSVTATNMISHGVDVARFNFMIFFGMPTQTAEYIQSSSRVGRSHVGIVFLCFNPNRERDQSHYQFFKKYHEYQDRLVEPVPINRWSKFSIKKTLPGLFTGLLLNYYYYSLKDNLYFAENVRKLIEEGKLKEEEIIQCLMEAYGTNDPGSEDFKYEIQQMVKNFFNLLRNPKKQFVSESIDPKPMNSLRDIDEPISFIIENEYYDLFQAIRRENQ
jgi:hypothetical protein